MAEAPVAEPRALPVFPIVGAAIRDVWHERRAVLRFGALPFAAALVLHVLFVYLGVDDKHDPGSVFLVNAVRSVPNALFAVSLFRHLLGQRERQPALRWEVAHSVILVWSIVKFAVFGAVVYLASSSWVALLAVPCVVYGSARFCFVNPAVSVGEYPDLGLAWARSRGNGWALVAIRLVVWAIAIVPTAAASFAMTLLGTEWPSALGRSTIILTVMLEIVGSATVAHCFYRLRDRATVEQT